MVQFNKDTQRNELEGLTINNAVLLLRDYLKKDDQLNLLKHHREPQLSFSSFEFVTMFQIRQFNCLLAEVRYTFI